MIKLRVSIVNDFNRFILHKLILFWGFQPRGEQWNNGEEARTSCFRCPNSSAMSHI
jgi:hypothetical protein